MNKILISTLLSFLFLGSFAQEPAGYYDAAQGKTGTDLKDALYDIIKGHTEKSYDQVWDILKESDRDPNNSANVILIYTGNSVNAAQEYNGGSGWNREHTWAKSHGDFGTANGPGSDAHHLRASDINANSERGNKWFAECEGCSEASNAPGNYTNSTIWEPRDEMKGDVARMIFYMATRYEGENGEPDLTVVDYFPSVSTSEPVHAYLTDLLKWNIEDPVDNFEMNKNNVVYSYQDNRNPFIDHPEWVNCIWANQCSGLSFTSSAITEAVQDVKYTYNITFSGEEGETFTITKASGASWLALTQSTNSTATLTGTPTSSDLGETEVSLKLSDGTDEVFQNFTITVTDGNSLAFTSTPSLFAKEGVAYSYTITAIGNDGESLDISMTAKPSWMELSDSKSSSATKVLSGTPGVDDIGTAYVDIKLSDGTKTVHQIFDIKVSDASAVGSLIITQYYEGSSGNNKFIEITNVGEASIDLSSYFLGRWSGTSNPSGVYDDGAPLSGTINAGESKVYMNPDSDTPAYATIGATGTLACYFNGDDPVALMKGGNTWADRVDCIYAAGEWGESKGFYRKATVMQGNLDMSVLDGTGEWVTITEAAAQNATSTATEYIGYHVYGASNSIKGINSEFKIYPNPVTDVLKIETTHQISKIEIISLAGNVVLQPSTESIKNIKVSNLDKGIYFVKITNKQSELALLKFVKQ